VKWWRGLVFKVTLRVDTEQEMTFDVVAVSRKLNPLKTLPTVIEKHKTLH